MRVLATPAMIAFMEYVALKCVEPYLQPGQTTVGVLVNVRHLNPSPEGSTVDVEAELVAVEGRRLTFKVVARLGNVLIGEGTHERYVVDVDKFLARVRRVSEEAMGPLQQR
ncbi:MAG: thioesterase family protein [Desulfurococcaceae archaeon]